MSRQHVEHRMRATSPNLEGHRMNLVYEEPNHRPRSQGQRIMDVIVKLSYFEVRSEAKDMTQEEALHLWRLIEPYYRGVKRAKWNELVRKMRLIRTAARESQEIDCPSCGCTLLVSRLIIASDIIRCQECGCTFNGARAGLRGEPVSACVERGSAWMASIGAGTASPEFYPHKEAET